jgi:AcrR family transcriptional regulator
VTKPDKRREIMNVAERLFTTRRYHEITTDAIAAEAGVGKGTIYRYFHDKEDLFFQTAVSGFDELCDLIRDRKAGGANFSDQLLAVCTQVREFFDRRRQLFRMMHSEEMRILMAKGSMHDRWVAHRQRLRGVVAEILKQGVAAGEIRSDISAEALAMLLLGMIRTLMMDLPDAPPSARRLEVVVDLFCRGAGGSPAAPIRNGRVPAGRRAM